MLANLTIRQLTITTTDKRVSREVASRENAYNDAGKYNKRLLAKDATARIQSAASNLRNLHYKYTLPWSNDGMRILPTATYFEYVKQMNEGKDAFYAAVTEFIQDYTNHVSAARSRLGNMFNPEDYPDSSDIRNKFGVEFNFLPMPDASDFRANLPSDQIEHIKRDIEEQTQAAIQRGMDDVFHRAVDVLQHMTDKLATYQPANKSKGQKAVGIFRDSLVTNIKELADLLPSLNVANDPKLHKLSVSLASLAGDYDPNDLRNDASTRASAQHEANRILNTLKDYIT